MKKEYKKKKKCVLGHGEEEGGEEGLKVGLCWLCGPGGERYSKIFSSILKN